MFAPSAEIYKIIKLFYLICNFFPKGCVVYRDAVCYVSVCVLLTNPIYKPYVVVFLQCDPAQLLLMTGCACR